MKKQSTRPTYSQADISHAARLLAQAHKQRKTEAINSRNAAARPAPSVKPPPPPAPIPPVAARKSPIAPVVNNPRPAFETAGARIGQPDYRDFFAKERWRSEFTKSNPIQRGESTVSYDSRLEKYVKEKQSAGAQAPGQAGEFEEWLKDEVGDKTPTARRSDAENVRSDMMRGERMLAGVDPELMKGFQAARPDKQLERFAATYRSAAKATEEAEKRPFSMLGLMAGALGGRIKSLFKRKPAEVNARVKVVVHAPSYAKGMGLVRAVDQLKVGDVAGAAEALATGRSAILARRKKAAAQNAKPGRRTGGWQRTKTGKLKRRTKSGGWVYKKQ